MAGDTIAAIATPLARGGIGVVRISGENALNVADKIFRAKRRSSLRQVPAYTAAYGHVYAGEQMLDECISLVFKAPKSYTGEDVVELSCHGGIYIIRRVLEAALEAGARLAEPGEFTKRAFLNGRLDLTRAEAVMDIISAKGEQAAKAALAQHEGALFHHISNVKAKLYDISADICAFVDFPEEDIPDLSSPVLLQKLSEINEDLRLCSESYHTGRVMREGVSTVIVGKPNVGKSTLMNLLAGTDRSIVTEIAGTTRDIIEESVTFAGCQLNLADTAGLRETSDRIESMGVERTRNRIESAQLIFAVFDGSRQLEEEDKSLLDSIKGRPAVAVINKADLPLILNKEYIKNHIQYIVEISAQKGQGIKELEAAISHILDIRELDMDVGILTNLRQLTCVKDAKEGIEAAVAALQSGMTLDAVSTGVEQAISQLSELTGERASEEVIERVFEKFCVGK